jgi:2'-5' RNA ligase
MRAELINLDFSELRIQGGGCFPNNRNPRIIWLGLNPSHGIKKVVVIIELVSESYGYKKENRSFNPHLTIGRVKKHASAVEKDLIAKSIPTLRQYESEPFQFRRIRLIQSTLTPAGPIYKDVFELWF